MICPVLGASPISLTNSAQGMGASKPPSDEQQEKFETLTQWHLGQLINVSIAHGAYATILSIPPVILRPIVNRPITLQDAPGSFIPLQGYPKC